MNKFKLILFYCLCFNFISSYASEKEEDPIDVSYKNCTKSASSTSDFISCSEQTYKSWDKALNEVYKKLILENIENKAVITAAQKAWLKFRDAEFQLLDKIYDSLDGTMWVPEKIYDKTNIIKERVKTLRYYLNIKEHI